jgi:integrase
MGPSLQPSEWRRRHRAINRPIPLHDACRGGIVSPKRVTFSALAKDVFAAKAASFKSGSSSTSRWKRYLDLASALNEKDVAAISIADVLAVLTSLWQTKPSAADRVRQAIEAVLDAAIVQGHRTLPNVARWKGTLSLVLPKRKALVNGHHAAMPYQQVPAFMAQLRQTESTLSNALQFIILTALRKMEALSVEWSWINNDVLTIPAANMKTGQPFRVPLSPAALAILEKQRIVASASALVFPSPYTGKRLGAASLNDALLRQRCEYTIHGWRSSFRDFAGDMTDAPQEVAEACLAHTLGPVERAYRRGDALEKRRTLMVQWANFVPSAPV